ncbi:MAG: hypothetical protein ACTSQG_00140 [Promethearchaeota archaeon]
MANRKVHPEKRRIPMIVTIQKKTIDIAKNFAEENDMSLSAYVEKILIKDLGIKIND